MGVRDVTDGRRRDAPKFHAVHHHRLAFTRLTAGAVVPARRAGAR
jgi:hypothetical protein